MLLIEKYRQLRLYNGLRWEAWNQKMLPQGSNIYTEWSLAREKVRDKYSRQRNCVYKDPETERNRERRKGSVSRIREEHYEISRERQGFASRGRAAGSFAVEV